MWTIDTHFEWRSTNIDNLSHFIVERVDYIQGNAILTMFFIYLSSLHIDLYIITLQVSLFRGVDIDHRNLRIGMMHYYLFLNYYILYLA